MGTYVLSVCFLNFIAGFAAAMYMHNPRLFRLRKRKKTTAEPAFASDAGVFEVGDSSRGVDVEWSLPASWREALLLAKLPTDASPETVEWWDDGRLRRPSRFHEAQQSSRLRLTFQRPFQRLARFPISRAERRSIDELRKLQTETDTP